MCQGIVAEVPCTALEGEPVVKRRLLRGTLAFVSKVPEQADGSAPPLPTGVRLVDCVAGALQAALPKDSSTVSGCRLFDSEGVPGIPLRTYLRRLYRDFRCSDSVFVCALVILDRSLEAKLADGSETLELTPRNVHRLFLASAVISVKFCEDLAWRNSQLAKIGGAELQELNRYEAFLLERLGFRVNVSEEEYKLYHSSVAAKASLRTFSTRPYLMKALVQGAGCIVARGCFDPCCGSVLVGLALWLRLRSSSQVPTAAKSEART
mmetsp:Transcript_81980/g.265594  ORF Transcript_81980/g.265594 Transcript_81980/m.265594 type:complete len:265 (+) Transcript_81980:71-865(+)